MDQRKEESKFCLACLRDNEQNGAIHWCFDCMETLCDTCGRVHKKSKFTTSHKLVPLAEVNNTASFLFTAPFLCTVHSTMRLNLYCPKHDILLCQSCILHMHRDCKEIIPIDEIISQPQNENTKKEELVSLHQQSLKIAKLIDALILKRHDNLKGLKAENKYIKELIIQIRLETEKQLSKLETDLETKYESCVQQIEQELSELRHSKELIDISEKDVILIQDAASHSYIFAVTKKFDQIKEKTNEALLNMQEKNEALKLSFMHNDALFQKNNNGLFGWIDINVLSTGRPSTRSTNDRPSTRSTAASTMRPVSKLQERPPRPGSRLSSSRSQRMQLPRIVSVINDTSTNGRQPVILTSYSSFQVSKSFSETVQISRGCFLPERHVLLCDSKNRYLYKVKLYGSLTDKIHLLYVPQDVDLFDMTRVVVCAGSRGIQIINIKNGECHPNRFIQPGGKCTAVSCVDDQIFVRNGTCKISIADIHGNLILKINTKFDPLFITADNKSGSGSIYWTSNYTDEVQCVAAERSQQIFKTNNLIGPSGLAADGTGNVFVAGYSSGNIHYISNAGTPSMVVYGGLDHPLDLAFDNDSKRLMVINENGSSIDIYTIRSK